MSIAKVQWFHIESIIGCFCDVVSIAMKPVFDIFISVRDTSSQCTGGDAKGTLTMYGNVFS